MFAHIKDLYPLAEHIEASTIAKARTVLEAIYQLYAFANPWETEDDIDPRVNRQYRRQRDVLRAAVAAAPREPAGKVMRDTLAKHLRYFVK